MPDASDVTQIQTRIDDTIEWLHAPDLWVLFLLVVPPIILVLAWVHRGEKGLVPWRRVLLTGLRAVLVFSIIAFLCEPILTSERSQTRSGQILLLVDDSYSMGITDRYGEEARQKLEQATQLAVEKGTRRIDLVQAFLDNPANDFIARLRRKGTVRVVACSDGVRTVGEFPKSDELAMPAAAELPALELRGKVSRIGDSMYEAVNDLRGETVSAAVLFTDGRDNGSVLRLEEAARRLAKRDIPVYPVGVGNSDEPKDIRIFSLEIPEVVLEGDTISVDFSATSDGFEGQRVRASLTLLDGSGVPIDRPETSYMVLAGKGVTQVEHIEFIPRHSGTFLARVEVEVLEGELFEENNVIEKPITVLSQKIKVLYVDGPPRYEYRYLKNALILDPTMEAQILLLSADPTFIQEASTGLPSLVTFPRTREELFQYHLVILGDVPPEHRALPEGWQDWLLEFVDEIGGGVVFIAGRNLPSRYRGTPIEKLFPVELEDSEPSPLDTGVLRTEFRARRTAEGREHPVMQIDADAERNALLWGEVTGREYRELPGFHWYSRVKTLKRGGVALAVHSNPAEDHVKYGPRPLFAYQFLGRGRTFISLVDGTWRWRRNVGNLYFYKFWGQAIRFASAGRLLGKTQRFSISTDQREYTLGSPIRVLARMLDAEFKPTGDTECTVHQMRVAPGTALGDRPATSGDKQALAAVQVPARPAYYEVTLEARELGEHRVWLEEGGAEVAATSYRVLVPQLEYEEPRMDEPGLRQVAELSRGKYHALEEAAAIPDLVPMLETPIPISREQKPLWDRLWLLALFVGVISLEWILRKVFRLL